MLFWTREEYQTFRVDIDVLFGRELLGRGHAIDFVMQAGSTSVPPGPHPWCGRIVHVGPTGGHGLAGRIAKHLRGAYHDLRALRLARRSDYDAIQVRDKFFIAAVALAVARRRGLKFFFWLSFPYPEDDSLRAQMPSTRFRRLVALRGKVSAWLLYRWILPRADHTFVQSERMRQDIAVHGVPVAKMTPVPMGIDLADVPEELRTAPLPRDGEVILGYLGTLSADRHIETLVDMLAELRRTLVRVRLLLIGDAHQRADREAIVQRAHALGVSQWLEITGYLPRLEALRRMRDTHIALSPYFPAPLLMSTSPTKLVEYLALGLPVVASDHPEQRAILRESGAGVCAPWGARHFARSVRWLMRLPPQKLAAMGERGRPWVQEHRTYSHIADNLEKVYLRQLDLDEACVH